MKIIEALKELRLIEKKITRNQEYIERYSSLVSTEAPIFNTLDVQRAKVASLIQENLDLARRKLDLKTRIAFTNLRTYVSMSGERWSLQNLLDLQRGTLQSIRDTYDSLSDRSAQGRLRGAMTIEGKAPQVVRLYDENAKLTQLDHWDTLKEEISSRLEVINAVTDLLDLPV